MWYALWISLAVGALAAPVLLGWQLWGKGRALVRTLAEAGEQVGAVFTPGRDGTPPRAVPTLLAADTPARMRALRATNRSRRGERRCKNLARVQARWERHGL